MPNGLAIRSLARKRSLSLERLAQAISSVPLFAMEHGFRIRTLGSEKVVETVRLMAVGAAGEEVSVLLEIPDKPPLNVKLVRADGMSSDFVGSDLFECMIEIRRSLEEESLLLCCQGARPDVFPSGMARQMGDGRRAYILRPGVLLTDEDLVDIFAPAPSTAVVTVDQQRRAVKTFFGFQA